MALIPGVTVEMGGREFAIPPPSFGTVIRLTEDGTWAAVTSPPPDAADQAAGLARLRQVAHFIHAAMARNYPDLTEADVLDLIDRESAPKAIMAILGVTIPERHRSPEGEQQPHHG